MKNTDKADEGLVFFVYTDCDRGLLVTTIDRDLSLWIRSKIRTHLHTLAPKHVTNAALIAVRPDTREVILYEGSRDFEDIWIDGQVDVLRSLNQMGSTMKPFLYLLALKQWYRIHDLLVDISDTYPSFQAGLTSISENYTLREYGLVRLSQALGNSLNNATIRLARMIGLSDVYAWYQDYGLVGDFPAEYYGYALVLGNPDITMIDLIRAYLRLVPSSDHTDYAEKFLLYHILSDPDNRDISFGVHSLLSTSIPQAVKTGTSSNFRDNTLMSYSPDMVIGIWVGNNDNSPMVGVTGITGAGVLWHETVEEMIRRGFIHERDLPIPSGIEKKMYCLDIPCYRREITYDKQGSLYESRISDGHYDRRDIPGLSSAEYERLHDLGFIVR